MHFASRNLTVHHLLERIGLRHESRQVEADSFKIEWTTLDGFAVLASEWEFGGSRREE